MLRPGDLIIICVLCLLCVGAVMVNSAGLSVGASAGVGGPGGGVTFESIVLSRSTAYAALAVIAMLLLSRARLDRLAEGRVPPQRLFLISFAFVAFCMLVYIPGIGREINGASRWIGLPLPGLDLSFQPSEVAKWGMVIALAMYCTTAGSKLETYLRGLLPALLATGIVAGFVILEDLGTGFLIIVTAGVMLLAAGARLWHFLAMAPLALLGLAAAVIARPYRMQRLITFLDPYSDPEKSGYHMIQSLIAVANGRVFGRGLGFGLQKFGYLPADRSDFLFAVICEELGLAGAAVVVALYMGVLVAGWRIVVRERLFTMRLIGLGILTAFALQALMNLAVVTGLGPTKGIALPLLSAGGTGWILTAASLGLLIGMDRRQRFDERAAPEPPSLFQRAAPVSAVLGAPSRSSAQPAAPIEAPPLVVHTRASGAMFSRLESLLSRRGKR